MSSKQLSNENYISIAVYVHSRVLVLSAMLYYFCPIFMEFFATDHHPDDRDDTIQILVRSWLRYNSL